MSDGGGVGEPEAWRGDQHPPERPELPKGAVAWLEPQPGMHLPVYFCLKCEQKSAAEGTPQTPDAIKKWGAEAVVHVCLSCRYVRQVEPNYDTKAWQPPSDGKEPA